MGKIYGGVSGTAREAKKIYAGVNGVAKEIKKVYVGVNGVAKLIWEADGGNWRYKYQQVEFIQGTGTQYINTGYVMTAPTCLTVDFALTSKTINTVTYFIGSYRSSRIGIALNAAGTGRFTLGLGNGYNASINADTNRHTAVFDSPNKKVYFDGTSRSTSSGSWSSVTGNNEWLGILGAQTGASTTVGLGVKVKVYHVYAEEAGSRVHDYYPVYRKSDNEPGLYDIITGNFYNNSGTGDIIVGSDVTTVL